MFEHLDDHAAPAAPATALVAARGLAIRRRRRLAAGGGLAAAAVGLLLVTTLPGGGANPDALDVLDPTPSASGDPTSDPSPTSTPGTTSTPTGGPTVTAAPTRDPAPPSASAPATRRPGGVPAYDGAALTPPRTRFPGIPPCGAAQVAQGHPAASSPPAGIQVTAKIPDGMAKNTERGTQWNVTLTVRNNGSQPVDFEDRGAVGALFHRGTFAGGGDEQASPRPTPSPVSRTLGPGQTFETTTYVTTLSCTAGWHPLPYAEYALSTGIRTDKGTWYAPDISAWIAPTMMPNTDCFAFDPEARRAAPVEGLTLTAEAVPATLPEPDSSFTARLVVTNTSRASREIVDLEPGRRVAYLVSTPPYNQDKVQGGWTVGTDLAPVTYVLAPGERKVFDVPVRGEGCQEQTPMVSALDLVLGIATVKDGKPYLWTTARTRVRYPH